MTESMMLDEPDLAESTLRQLRAMGVRLALDDFGTGYLVAVAAAAFPDPADQDRPGVRAGHRPPQQ